MEQKSRDLQYRNTVKDDNPEAVIRIDSYGASILDQGNLAKKSKKKKLTWAKGKKLTLTHNFLKEDILVPTTEKYDLEESLPTKVAKISKFDVDPVKIETQELLLRAAELGISVDQGETKPEQMVPLETVARDKNSGNLESLAYQRNLDNKIDISEGI